MNTKIAEYHVCLLRCSDNSLYTLSTKGNPDECIAHHNAGNGPPYTKGRRPVSLEASFYIGNDRYDAMAVAYAIRKLSKTFKERLCSGNKTNLDAVLSKGREMGPWLRETFQKFEANKRLD
mgnify:FL=1